MKTIFKEKQKFNQWWLWLILIGLLSLPFIELFNRLIFNVKTDEKSIPLFGLILVIVFVSGLVLLFWRMNLKTEIDETEIRMHYFPFLKKVVKREEIKNAQIVNYGFVGYGIRFGSKYGTIYNTSGKYGLAIELKNGKKFVIGTLKKEELNELIPKLSLFQ